MIGNHEQILRLVLALLSKAAKERCLEEYIVRNHHSGEFERPSDLFWDLWRRICQADIEGEI